MDPTKDYDFTAEIIRDAYNVLNDYGCYDISIDINNPFDGFSLTDIIRPYSAFRMNFNKTAPVDWFGVNPYTYWILRDGVWLDAGIWKDGEHWID